MTKPIYYAGIGGRILPDGMYDDMVEYGKLLAHAGLILRSGAAPGSDVAFEEGCESGFGQREIYLPWKQFDGHTSDLWHISDDAYLLAEKFYHSDWNKAKQTTKAFMARDLLQVTGANLDEPVDFVVCYTRDGCESWETRTATTGGTGQAIAYASTLDIPVFNLYNKGRDEDFLTFVERYI